MMIANEYNLDNIFHFYGFSSTLKKELFLMQQQPNNKMYLHAILPANRRLLFKNMNL